MRDARTGSRKEPAVADFHRESGAVPRRRRRRWLVAVSVVAVVSVFAVMVVTAVMSVMSVMSNAVDAGRDRHSDLAGVDAALREPAQHERLALSEVAALRLEASPVDAPPMPPGIDRQERRRYIMVRARLQLQKGSPHEAVALMDAEEAVASIDVDAAWRALRLQALRRSGRGAMAEAECAAWRLSLSDDHPDRAWADAEWALDRALEGDFAGAERLSAPWLDRALSPLPASRLRLAEAMIRSARGDHAVAAAALERAVELDRSVDPRAGLGDALLLDVASELSEAAAASSSLAPAIALCERALALSGESSRRGMLLERHATLCRAEAMRLLASTSHATDPIEAERVNRRLLSAAESAQSLASRLSTDTRGDAPRLRSAALFTAAECLELAGRGEEAVATWRAWLLTRPESDAQRAEVLSRVAATLHAMGRHLEAADAWRHLLRAHPNSPESARAPIAAARSLRALQRDADAIPLLDEVIEGRGGIDPDASSFVEALVERGRLAHAMGDAVTARRRFEEALRREPQHRDAVELAVLLADSWRLEAMAHEQASGAPSPPSARAQARSQAMAAWQAATIAFAESIERLDRREAATPATVDAALGALARLGLAESLEAVGRRAEAILAYEEVERRYSDAEVCLVALDRLRHLAAGDDHAFRRRAERRIEGLAAGSRLLSNEAWRAWFDIGQEDRARRSLAGGVGG